MDRALESFECPDFLVQAPHFATTGLRYFLPKYNNVSLISHSNSVCTYERSIWLFIHSTRGKRSFERYRKETNAAFSWIKGTKCFKSTIFLLVYVCRSSRQDLQIYVFVHLVNELLSERSLCRQTVRFWLWPVTAPNFPLKKEWIT